MGAIRLSTGHKWGTVIPHIVCHLLGFGQPTGYYTPQQLNYQEPIRKRCVSQTGQVASPIGKQLKPSFGPMSGHVVQRQALCPKSETPPGSSGSNAVAFQGLHKRGENLPQRTQRAPRFYRYLACSTPSAVRKSYSLLSIIHSRPVLNRHTSVRGRRTMAPSALAALR